MPIGVVTSGFRTERKRWVGIASGDIHLKKIAVVQLQINKEKRGLRQ